MSPYLIISFITHVIIPRYERTFMTQSKEIHSQVLLTLLHLTEQVQDLTQLITQVTLLLMECITTLITEEADVDVTAKKDRCPGIYFFVIHRGNVDQDQYK